MYELLFDELFKYLAGRFANPGSSSLQQAIDNLLELPIPDLSSQSFKAVYAIMWAIGIAAGIVTGAVTATIYYIKNSDGVGTTIPFTERMFFFYKVFIVGIIAPPVTAGLLLFLDKITHFIVDLANGDGDNSWLNGLLDIIIGFSPSDMLMSLISAIALWTGTHALTNETAALSLAVIPVLLCNAFFYSLSIIDGIGHALWRMWVAFWLVTITAKAAIVAILSFGLWYIGWNERVGLNVVQNGNVIIASITISFAALSPIIMFFLYMKYVTKKIPRAAVTGRVSTDGNRPGMTAAVSGLATAGVTSLAMRQSASLPGDTTINTPGYRRIQASGALSRGALTLASKSHPVAATAVLGGSALIGASAAKAKQQPAVIPITPLNAPELSAFDPPTPPSNITQTSGGGSTNNPSKINPTTTRGADQ